MISIKTDQQIQGMKEAGVILSKTHLAIQEVLRPGITTMQLNDFAEAFMYFKEAIPAQLGYQDYPFALCTSVNDEICHGYPTHCPLQEGDIVSIDNVVNYKGFLADSCWSYAVGELSEENAKLMAVTKEALYRGIEAAKVGNHVVDIGKAIQSYVEAEGFSVVRNFVGHGIGIDMHESPQIPHYNTGIRGPRLRENMVITVEPMINVGKWQMKLDDNEWTARTIDGSMSCQFEHTFAIKKDGAEILTNQEETSLTQEELAWIEAWKVRERI